MSLPNGFRACLGTLLCAAPVFALFQQPTATTAAGQDEGATRIRWHNPHDPGPQGVNTSPVQEPGVPVEELLERPLIVNGHRIPTQEIKRMLLFGPGGKILDSMKFQLIMNQELDTLKLQGADLSKYGVSDEEFQAEVDRQRTEFELDYPTLDFGIEVGRAFTHVDLWKHHLRQTMSFDKIFLQDNPDEWPPRTQAAIIDESGGLPIFVDDAKEVYQDRVGRMMSEGLSELPPWPPMYLDILRSMVLDSMHKFAYIEYFPSRLEEGAIMSVDGMSVMIDDAWELLGSYVTWKQVQDARHSVATIRAIEDAIEALESSAGDGTSEVQYLMDHEEFDAFWVEHEYNRTRTLLAQQERNNLSQRGVTDPAELDAAVQNFIDNYRGEQKSHSRMLFDRQMYALQSMGFPSMWSFSEHKRLTDSYANVISEEFSDMRRMQSVLARTNLITSAAQAHVDVLLVSAFDYPTFTWKENGWTEAKAEAERLKALLDGGADWAETLELHSDFWDPPQPAKSKARPMYSLKLKGAWGPQSRNQLLQHVVENEFQIWLYGKAVSDYAFFEQPVGSIAGPFRGPDGYYLTRVVSRAPAGRSLNMAEERHVDLLKEYYLRSRFNHYTQEVLRDASIQGLYGNDLGELSEEERAAHLTAEEIERFCQ